MGLATYQSIVSLLACPACRGELSDLGAGLSCEGCGAEYEEMGGVPILVDFSDSVLRHDVVVRSGASSPIGPRMNERRDGVHMATVASNLARLRAILPQRARVLVVGGGENSHGLDWLYASDSVDVIGFDVYVSRLTQFVADAHRIPIHDEAIDAVVVQAVLEHVLDPERVVAEIHRVLKPTGVVYAETAFLQAVHEGPYDFMRFTERGHRWLFRSFEEIDSGAIGGAGLSLVWALDYFVRAATRKRRWGLRARKAVSWLARADGRTRAGFKIDAATAVYFLGRRSDEQLSPSALISGYQGAAELSRPAAVK